MLETEIKQATEILLAEVHRIHPRIRVYFKWAIDEAEVAATVAMRAQDDKRLVSVDPYDLPAGIGTANIKLED